MASWNQLFGELDAALSAAARAQMACEIIMLTYNRELHERTIPSDLHIIIKREG